MNADDYQAALSRLDRAIAADEVIRGAWTAERDGRHLGCLLATLAPECGEQQSVEPCPAWLMAPWLAYLTPSIDDRGSLERRPEVLRRYAAALRGTARWSAARWHRADYAVRALCVREAMRHTDDAATLAVCERVAVLCERVAAGDEAALAELSAAAAAAAWAAAAWAAARAAYERMADGSLKGWSL